MASFMESITLKNEQNKQITSPNKGVSNNHFQESENKNSINLTVIK